MGRKTASFSGFVSQSLTEVLGTGHMAGACIRFGRAGSGSDFDTDQSRSVYLVRLISIWYCNWFMLFMTLDMPDEGTR